MLQFSCGTAAAQLLLCGCAAVGQEVVAQQVEASRSVDEIAAELSNPTAALGSITSNLDYKSFSGDLPESGSQDSLTWLIQPTLPFPQGNGYNLLFRPALPILIDQPVFDAGSGSFESETWALGDMGFDLVYGTTTRSGLLYSVGVVGSIPIATDDALGSDQWLLGPEVLIGVAKDWGVLGLLVGHQWDVAGEDGFDTSLTTGQYFYAFPLGNGWQFASGPAFSYDHEATTLHDGWTLPLGVGVAKTVVVGKMPLKLSLQYWSYLETPDTFGPDWQVRFTVTPVVRLPWSE